MDPDAWLTHYDRQAFRHRVRSNGSVSVDSDRYYISRAYAAQLVLLRVDASAKQFEVWHDKTCLKRCAIRNLFHGKIAFEDYVELMIQVANLRKSA